MHPFRVRVAVVQARRHARRSDTDKPEASFDTSACRITLRYAALRDLTKRNVCRYAWFVIKTFANKRTAAVFAGQAVRGLPMQIQRRARAKLLAIEAAAQLDDLRAPPGNRLEALRGDRRGRYSLRINDRWRICFVWRDGEAWEVEIVDYH